MHAELLIIGEGNNVIKRMIAGLQWLDSQINAPGFKTGAITGATLTAAAGILLWVVL